MVAGGVSPMRRGVSGGGAETTTAPGGTSHLARRRPAMAASMRGSDSGGAALDRGGGFGPGRRLWTRRACGRDSTRMRRGDGADSGARSGGLSGRRRAVLTASLRHASGAVRGSHPATARCQAGLARRAASDRWDPQVSVF
jgi:hypothetical protein